MGKLVLLFIVVPAVELGLLMRIGGVIGLLPTVGIIVLTGALGAGLARHQGLGVLRLMQAEMAGGRLPAQAMVDGVIILVAGALLMTPGFLTDIVGFLCLIPATRAVIKRTARTRLERAIEQGRINVYVGR